MKGRRPCDDQAIASGLRCEPVRILVRLQKNAADLVRVLGIVHVEAHNCVATLHGLDEIIADDDRNFAHPITEVIDVLERWMLTSEIPHQEQPAVEVGTTTVLPSASTRGSDELKDRHYTNPGFSATQSCPVASDRTAARSAPRG